MTGRGSVNKGKKAERAVARAFRGAGFDAQRNIQTRGPDAPDVISSCFWNEVKDRKSVSCRSAWEQAQREAPDSLIPVAITHMPRRDWLVTIRLEDWLAILSGMQQNVVALDSARAHVWRQGHVGTHTQDRWDAYVWWQTWGDGGEIHPTPKNPDEEKEDASKRRPRNP